MIFFIVHYPIREKNYIKRSFRVGYISPVDLFYVKYQVFPITGRYITCRTKSVNTSRISCLAVTACHAVDIHILGIRQVASFKINRRTIFTTPETNLMIFYPPLTLPCLRHLGKCVNQIRIIIGYELGRLLYCIVYFRNKFLLSEFIAKSIQVVNKYF